MEKHHDPSSTDQRARNRSRLRSDEGSGTKRQERRVGTCGIRPEQRQRSVIGQANEQKALHGAFFVSMVS